MNSHIVWSYFIAVKISPNTYRKTIFDLWNKKYDIKFSEQITCDQRRIKARNKQLRGSWFSQIETDTIRDEINRLEHTANEAEEPTVENGQNEQEPQINQLQDVYDAPPNHEGEVQQEEGQHLEQINTRKIVKIFDENFANARLTPLSKQIRFCR